MRRIIIVSLLLLAVSAAEVTAQSSPFLTPPQSQQRGRQPGTQPSPGIERWVPPLLPGRVGTALVEWQRLLNAQLTGFLRQTAGGALRTRSVLLVVLLSFSYGVLHAVLPGHRKTVIVSYFLYEPAPLRVGIGAGFLFAALHAISAIALVVVVYLVLQTAGAGTLNRLSFQLQIASSLMIIAVGVLFFAAKLRATLKGRRRAAALRMNRALGFEHRERLEQHVPRIAAQRLIPVLISTGIVPCPVTTLVVLFALSFGILGIGILSAVAISLGLGVALAAIAVMTIVLKERFVSLLNRRWGAAAQAGIEVFAALMLVGFGLLTLFAAG